MTARTDWAAYMRARRQAKREAGECRDCLEPADAGVRCEAHAEAHRLQVRGEYQVAGKARKAASRARQRARRDEARARVMET